METHESIRFSEYVRSNTRVDAQTKRLALFRLLDGRTFTNITALVAAVGGNSKDRVWVSQAIKDGEIVMKGGALGLPNARAGLSSRDAWLEQLGTLITSCPIPWMKAQLCKLWAEGMAEGVSAPDQTDDEDFEPEPEPLPEPWKRAKFLAAINALPGV